MFSTKHWLDTEQVYSYDYLVDFRHSFSYIKLTVLIIETNFTLNMLVVTSDSAPELACWSHNYYIWFRFVYLRDWDLCSWFLVFLKIHFLKIPGWVCHLVAWSCVASADMEIGEIAVSHGISVFLHFPKAEYWKWDITAPRVEIEQLTCSTVLTFAWGLANRVTHNCTGVNCSITQWTF